MLTRTPLHIVCDIFALFLIYIGKYPLCCWLLIWPVQNDTKTWKMTETLAHEYSSDSTQWELSNEYQHDRVKMVFKDLCILYPCALNKCSLSIGREIIEAYDTVQVRPVGVTGLSSIVCLLLVIDTRQLSISSAPPPSSLSLLAA